MIKELTRECHKDRKYKKAMIVAMAARMMSECVKVLLEAASEAD